MKHQSLIKWIAVMVLLLLPWIYLAIVWKDLPPTIPIHFGPSGKPDGFGNKNEVLIGPVILTVMGVLVYLLLTNISKIDPKRYAQQQSDFFNKMGLAVVLLLSALNLLIIRSTVKGYISDPQIILMLIGLFFAYMGNLMHTLKPNYFAGIRLPWTLESEDNWKATHQLAGKVWFGGGLLIALLSFFLPIEFFVFVMLGIVGVMVIIPVIFSYRYFKKSARANEPS